MDADFFLVVVGFLAYVFIAISYVTMGPRLFFQTLAAIASVLAIVWMLRWVHRNREKIRRSEELREQSKLVLDPPENRYMSLNTPVDLVETCLGGRGSTTPPETRRPPSSHSTTPLPPL